MRADREWYAAQKYQTVDQSQRGLMQQPALGQECHLFPKSVWRL
jgi:hypothetical protein